METKLDFEVETQFRDRNWILSLKLNFDLILMPRIDFEGETRFEVKTLMWGQTLFGRDFEVETRFWCRISILNSKLDFEVKTRFWGQDFNLDLILRSKLDFVIETRFCVQNLIWTQFWEWNSILGRFWGHTSILGSKLDFVIEC